MLQGGHHPDYGVEYYEELFAAVKQAYPQLVIHSIGASRDPAHGQGLRRLASRRRSRGSRRPAWTPSPAPARRCCPTGPRKAIAPLKESGERWLEVMEIAHGLGVESTATMMMGTGETNAERIEHLRMIRDVQDRTGGFRAFIPWTYQPENNHLKGRTQATTLEYLRLIAVARLFFDNVAHLQGVLADHRQGRRPAVPAHGRGRPRLDHAGGERHLLGGRPAPVQPARADRADPHRRPDPGAARHPLPAPARCTATRPTTRPTTRVVSHFSSTALPLVPAP